MTDDNQFTELVKVQGFPTTQEALDEINRLLNLDEEDEFYTHNRYLTPMTGPMYAYLSGDGYTVFLKDLSSFDPDFQTEEGWMVTDWSTKPPTIG